MVSDTTLFFSHVGRYNKSTLDVGQLYRVDLTVSDFAVEVLIATMFQKATAMFADAKLKG